jgi:hypothetical protein
VWPKTGCLWLTESLPFFSKPSEQRVNIAGLVFSFPSQLSHSFPPSPPRAPKPLSAAPKTAFPLRQNPINGNIFHLMIWVTKFESDHIKLDSGRKFFSAAVFTGLGCTVCRFRGSCPKKAFLFRRRHTSTPS